MNTNGNNKQNVKQAVPFLMVTEIESSIHFYVAGLDFEITNQWIDDGKLRWCWLQLGGAAIMLQEFGKKSPHTNLVSGKLGQGVSICFICDDAIAIYKEAIKRGLNAERPFVGNNMWVTSFSDPDGYNIFFESDTDVPEETIYSE